MEEGQIQYFSFSEADSKGHETAYPHPAFILKMIIEMGMLFVIPLTHNVTKAKNQPFTVFIPKTQENRLKYDSIAEVFQARAIDPRFRLGEPIGPLESNKIEEIKLTLKRMLNL
ncbi:MAG: type II toxin-antitoxin system PemK/MazF family toxin [Nitrososphaeria archaeon]